MFFFLATASPGYCQAITRTKQDLQAMNVFLIPSWYPTAAKPHSGIFNKEQAEALAMVFPESNFALSTWGSHDPELLLWAKDPFKNLVKLAKYRSKKASLVPLAPNLQEYYSPAFSWSRKVLQGNIRNIIRVNEKHLLAFQERVGKADVIHAHTAYPAGWVAMRLAEKYSIPFIITEHMGPFPFKDFLLRSDRLSPYLQKPYSKAFANIAVSPQQKTTLENWGIPRVKHIPNLTNEAFFSPAGKPRDSYRPFTFFTLARLEAGKGIPYLLKAAKRLLAERTDVLLRIGGEGSEKESYQALAQELGIAEHIEWPGLLNRPQALQAYQQCDAFVLPSLHENLPLVLLEALACGKPVIGTYCGGPESIIHATNGLLVEPANTQALYEALLQMIRQHALYDQEEIRKGFCNRYSRTAVCSQLMALYQAASSNR